MPTKVDELIAALKRDHIEPNWVDGRPAGTQDGEGRIPWCIDACVSHDGKRCKLTGFRPDGICEPAVLALVQIVDLLGRLAPKVPDGGA